VVAKGSVVTDFAFSPDGSRVATASQDGTARAWDLETGQPITPPLRHGGPVLRVAFSPDGGRLATASDDRTARLWDAVSGKQIHLFAHGEPVSCVSFSPDGKRLVTLSRPNITVWEADSAKRGPQLYADAANGLQEAAFSADGRRIIATGGQRIVRIWDAETGTLQTPIPRGGLAWLSPDRSWVVSGLATGSSGSVDRPAQVWDVMTGQPVTPPLEKTRGTVEGAFSPQGDRLITTGADGTVRVWAIETAEVVAGPLRHSGAVTSAAFSPDGRLLVTRESTGFVRVWDLAGSAAPSSPLKSSLESFYRWHSANGRWVVTGSYLGSVWLWDGRTGRLVKTVNEGAGVFSVALSPDGSRLVAGGRSGVAPMRNAATGVAIGERLRHGGLVSHVEFSPDGRRVATAGKDKTACVWDAATGKPIAQMKHEFAVRWAAFSPDGRRLVTAAGDFSDVRDLLEPPRSNPVRLGEVRVWEVATGRPVTPLIHHEEVVLRASFSPDGRFILTTCVGRAANRYQVRVWDAADGRPVTPPFVHPQVVIHETFSPDGRLVATGCFDGAARVWDVGAGKALGFLVKHNSAVRHVAFSADSRRLLTASFDGTARLWDATTGQPIAVLPHPVGVWHAVFAADGNSVITGCEDASVRVWPLAPDNRPVDDWVALAELMAGGGRDTGSGRGREEDRAATWQRLRARYPGDFATTKAEQLAWHRAALEIAYRKKAWQPALAHLGRLLEIDPADWHNRLARARLLARLERWDEAEAEFTRAVKRHARVPQVWVARGSYFLGRGQREPAKGDFAKAIDLRASPELPAVLSEFWVAGLYPHAFKASFPPEAQLDPSRPIPAMADAKSTLRALPGWRGEVTDATGYLDLAACFDGREHISAYALAYVYSKTEQEVVLLVGSDDGIRLWLNGELIHANPAVRHAAPDQDRMLAKLRRGWNTVLAKVVNDTGKHGLFMRLSADPRELAEARVRPFVLTVQGTAQATLVRDGTVHRVDVAAVDGTHWHVQLGHTFGDLQEGVTYTVRFRAKADAPRQVNLDAQIAGSDDHGIGLNKGVRLTEDWQPYEYEFQAKDLAVGNRIVFNVGERTGTVWIADFTLTKSAK
jgi:WD40 repeat protein